MSIDDRIEKARENIREGRFTSEAAVSQGILLPILNELGWPVFNTSIVIPEFAVEGRRVDYALCHPEDKPIVFIEVKQVGLSGGGDRQLFEYAFHRGVPMAVLTDGHEWSFYLPGEQGLYDERRVYKLDILERNIDEIRRKFERYLSYNRICSGGALEAARSDYKNVARSRIIEKTIPSAWKALLKEQDSILLELLADKVEDLCGYKPELDICGTYLERQDNSIPKTNISAPSTNEVDTPPPRTIDNNRSRNRQTGKFVFTFKGAEQSAGSALQVMIDLFRLIALEDGDFLNRFASRRHGRRRRYLAQDKYELYPNRPDLAEQYSIEIVPGWWLGTNYSRPNIQNIIDLALEVVSPVLRRQIKAKVYSR